MADRKTEICEFLEGIRISNLALIAGIDEYASILDYAHLVREENGYKIWTDALQKALIEHRGVMIPAGDSPYYIDRSVRIPSNRHIEAAPDAVIRLCENVRVLMLRNENTHDGAHAPISGHDRNVNISINGGRWEESNTRRRGYGDTGMYDESRSLFGVSTCMLFNNIENLTLTNMTFARTAAFAIQIGDARNVVMENITFENCFADGIHINGSTENVLVRNISGKVGDDLVALNAYDWQNSSVNFGPARVILCENIAAEPGEGYKSMRLEPGIYTYDDETQVDCALEDVVIRRVSGVTTFKMYYQTPRYAIGADPEKGDTGGMNNIFFEDIDVDLAAPVDDLNSYMESDPVRGWFGAFEICSRAGYVSFENIRITLHENYPLTSPVVVGPKSIRLDQYEIFDPYITGGAEKIEFKNVYINGQKANSAAELVHITEFDDINRDGKSSGRGYVREITIE